jgi:hypothetical protein
LKDLLSDLQPRLKNLKKQSSGVLVHDLKSKDKCVLPQVSDVNAQGLDPSERRSLYLCTIFLIAWLLIVCGYSLWEYHDVDDMAWIKIEMFSVIDSTI